MLEGLMQLSLFLMGYKNNLNIGLMLKFTENNLISLFAKD